MTAVVATDEMVEWFTGLSAADQDAVDRIGGDKTGNGRFYEEIIPVAQKIWSAYQKEMRER